MSGEVLKRESILKNDITLVASFTFLMILAAFIRVHIFFSPVPITFQTFVLFLSLAFLKNKSYMPNLLYIIIGASGVPVFGNGGAGIIYIFGPTGGYLAGFLVSALLAGYVIRRFYAGIKKSLLSYIVLFSAVNVIVYACGASWLIGVYGVSVLYAFTAGIIPFIVPDVMKIIIASIVSYKLVK